jgi:gliding motility-associated-like protein
MKKNCCYIIILLFLVLSFNNKTTQAQHVLNGSFEINKIPTRRLSGKIGNVFKDLNIPFIEYRPADTLIGYSIGVFFKDTLNYTHVKSQIVYSDTLISSWYYSLLFSPKDSNRASPHGKTHFYLYSSNTFNPITTNAKINWLIFQLSDTLKKGKRYTLRFSMGANFDLFTISNNYSIVISLGMSNKKTEIEIDSFYLKDTVGYRDYVTTFVADNNYKYIYLNLLQGDIRPNNYNVAMIDNIRLDTCVNKPLTHYIGCAYLPETLKPTSIGKKYFWSNGDTTPTINVYKTGSYRSYTYDSLGCASIDSFVVSFEETPGSITNATICSGSSQILKATPAAATVNFIWNTGDTTESINITKGGTYWVTRGAFSCLITDSFYVTEINTPKAHNIDTTFCTNSPIIIGKTDAQKYIWNTNEQTPKISVNKQGLYWVIKSNPPCETTDTFNVTENALPIIKSLKDTVVCFDQVANILLDAGQFKSYLWKPTNETSRIIYSNNAQNYILQVTDSNNCVTSKMVTVTENCPQQLFIPNAFSPNGDGLNDVFNIVTTGVESYEIQIFNRWGIQIFSSQNYLQGWDGKNAPNDLYLYQVTYKLKDKPTTTINGNVTLMR